MTVRIATLVYWLCTALLVLLPLGALFLLVDIERFAQLASRHLNLPIQWHTVTVAQWYGLWVLAALYAAIGYTGTVFLRRAFRSFAHGAWFDADSSRNLRVFSVLLAVQGIAKPVQFALAGIVLSLQHPPGGKVLAVSVGSNEATLVVAGMILWVLSDLLVAGTRADAENRQFV